MVVYKDIEFENNPNHLSEPVQFKGEIYIKFADHPCMSVYGINESQVIEQANKFKEIEPKTFALEIYGPENYGSNRSYVTTHYFFES